MNIGDTVKFSYIDTDNEPATRDTDTIYFDSNTKKISVGDVKFDGGTVPTPTSDDNGKILIAGEEGAFDWGQPPEELPVITEGDEGKVLKVDEGVPKWLEDSDNEYLLVTITKSGTSPDYTYTADKTYDEIRPFAEKGRAIVIYDGMYYSLYALTSNVIAFVYTDPSGIVINDSVVMERWYNRNAIDIKSDNTVLYIRVAFYVAQRINISDNTTLQEEMYKLACSAVKGCSVICRYQYNNKYYSFHYAGSNSTETEVDFVCAELGLKAHIDANRLVTITSISKLPAATSADEGKVVMVDSNGDYVLGTVSTGNGFINETLNSNMSVSEVTI